jgi:hypothetical protein
VPRQPAIPAKAKCQRGKNVTNRVHDFTPTVLFRVLGISQCHPPEPHIRLAIIACAISLSGKRC